MGLSKKRIAVVCNYQLLPERVGGMDYFFWEFDAKCRENGFEVDWFFPNTSSHLGYEKLPVVSSEGEALESFFLRHLQQIDFSYDIVMTHFLELCTSFYKKVKQHSFCEIIAIDHNPRPLSGYSLKKRLAKRIKGFLFSRYIDLFVGVSNYTVQELIKDFGLQIKSKTHIIYNGISIGEIQTRLDRKKSHPTFLTASHLRYSKGIQDLIQAVYGLPIAIKNEIVIDVYGDGPYREELELKVTDLGLESCFNFMGSSSQLKSLYCNYDYMLQPTHMECFSLSILESLAANVPVVTTNVGGNEEVITTKENGFILPAQSVEVLTGILKGLWEGSLGITADTRVLIEERFTIDRMVENYVNLL